MENNNKVTLGNNPGCLVQLLWFVLVGSWVTQIWIAVAWLLMVLVITMPIGIAMIDMLPKVVALREPRQAIHLRGGVATVRDLPQHNFILRACYFLLIGWWLSAIWMELALLISITIIGLPLGLWMFDQAPGLMTLRRQ